MVTHQREIDGRKEAFITIDIGAFVAWMDTLSPKPQNQKYRLFPFIRIALALALATTSQNSNFNALKCVGFFLLKTGFFLMPLFFVSLPFLIHFPLRMGGGGHGVRPNIISIHVYLYFVPFSLVQP